MTIQKLAGVIQNYAWGSRSMLAQFQGRSVPSANPEAELWFGAHPLAPSSLEVDGVRHKLDAFIRDRVNDQLGAGLERRFGRLPFLLKVLAVDQPLSIQLHPSQEQAQQGFYRERLRGISIDDPRANYRDNWAKPELLCPLSEFEALCGFRPIGELVVLFCDLGGDCFARAAELLKAFPNEEGLRQVAAKWLSATGDTKIALFQAGLDACSRFLERPNVHSYDVAFVLDLASRYPGDMGVLVALLLRHLVLSPGVGLYVPAGVLHAYLRGFAVEVMANSDNVLRGGLTHKHVDVEELLNLGNFNPEPPTIVPLEAAGPLEKSFATEVSQFKVSCVKPEKYATWCASRRLGPEMLLAVNGKLTMLAANSEEVSLARGECAWISADEDIYCVSGEGSAYRVQVGT